MKFRLILLFCSFVFTQFCFGHLSEEIREAERRARESEREYVGFEYVDGEYENISEEQEGIEIEQEQPGQIVGVEALMEELSQEGYIDDYGAAIIERVVFAFADLVDREGVGAAQRIFAEFERVEQEMGTEAALVRFGFRQ